VNDRDRLKTYYLAGRIGTTRPRFLCVNATLRCDGGCSHCGIWREKQTGPELTAGQLGQVLSGELFQKIETAWITGGEPTLRDDLANLARAMTSSLPSLATLGIATNALDPGRVLASVRALAFALKAGQRLFVHVSLDGVGEVHDRVRRRPGAFAAVTETLAGLEKLKHELPEAGLEIGLNCVIQPANLTGLDELASFARERKLGLTFNVAQVTDQIYRSHAMAGQLTLSAEHQREVMAFFDRIMNESPPPLRYQYRIIKAVLSGKPRPGRCLTLHSTVNINADGTLIPCPTTSDLFPHHALKEDLAALHQSREAREFRRRAAREFCPECMLSCSLGDSMPLTEWLSGGWEGREGPVRKWLGRLINAIR
jgi:MoaA/NifB/PqqE/SkfB family radical SAM enzyme